METEVKALLRTFDTEWVFTPAAVHAKDASGLSKDVEVMGRGLLASMADGVSDNCLRCSDSSGRVGGGSSDSHIDCGGGNDGDSNGGADTSTVGLLASMVVVGSRVEEDARASFVSAAAAELDDSALSLGGSGPGSAGGGVGGRVEGRRTDKVETRCGGEGVEGRRDVQAQTHSSGTAAATCGTIRAPIAVLHGSKHLGAQGGAAVVEAPGDDGHELYELD
jgi:hypothetical protein